MYPDEGAHGFMPLGPRYCDRNLEDDNFRPFGNRGGEGRYFRNNRENRGSISQKDWRSPSWEPAALSCGPGRPTNEVNNQKSEENTVTCHEGSSKSNDTACPVPDPLPVQSPSLVKDSHEKTLERQVSFDEKPEKENGVGPIDWKPLKWCRSGSLTSRGSGFSHSSSSKSMGVDSETVEVQRKIVTPVQSPAAICVVSTAPAPSPSPSPTPSDETSSRKKPRLGWGEGLAKYEKKKVEPPDDGATKDVSVNDTEMIQVPSVSKSPVLASLSGCTSPATPSSVACSFSPGVEEKESIKTANFDNDTANPSCSPSTMSETPYDGPTFSLESLDLAAIAKLSSSINELLQSDDPSSGETGYARTTSMNKLLVWKVNILKTIEVTESEIDSLETELKSLVAASRPEERVTGSSPESLPAVVEDNRVALKDDEIDSPGSATSKLHVVVPSGEDNVPTETPQYVDLTMDSDDTSSEEDDELIKRNLHDLISTYNAHYDMGHIYGSVLSSNKDSMNMAMEELNKLLPAQQSRFDISTASSLQRDSFIIKEKFLMKRRYLKFKEKVIALKFKVIQHFWKEGRVVNIRKLRGKSHKKFDLSRVGCKKNRSAGRSRYSYNAGCSRTVPAAEVIEFLNGLLSELPVKPCRNTLKMPALILDKEIHKSRFISTNALVEDPCAVEKERLMINPWSAEERELFIDKLAAFGKNFVKIASFLEHKTVADCVEFYYKNHKSELFARARNKPDVGEQRKSQSSTYLVATGKRWNREVNAASLDMLGEASAIAASINEGVDTQQKCTSRIFMGASSSYNPPSSVDAQLQRTNSLDIYSNETVAADVLAGICGSLSSEAMSSCITTSVDVIDGRHDRKSQRVSSCIKRPLTPDVTQNVDDECSDESCGERESDHWTDEEKSVFIQALSSYGKDFAMISRCVGTKSRAQCNMYFSKARKGLGLDRIQPGVGNAVSGDVNGGGSDTEDACVVQTSSVVGSECKIEENLLPPDTKSSHESVIAGEHGMKTDIDTIVDKTAPCSLDPPADDLASKNLSTSDMVVDDNSAIDFNVESKNDAPGCDGEARTLAVSSNIESVGVEGDNDANPNEANVTDQVVVAEVSPSVPEDNLGSKKVDDNDANSTDIVSCSVNGTTSEPQMAENIVHHSVHEPSTSQIEYAQERTEAELKICNTEKPCVVSSDQNGYFPPTPTESSTLFSVPIKYQRQANGTSEKNPQKIARTVDSQQHLSGFSVPNPPVDFQKVLRGFPVSVQNLKEMNGNVNCKRNDEKLLTDFSLQKCSSQKLPSEVVQAPFSSYDRSRPQSGSSSDADKPSSNGDVKLFGKILTSAQQKQPDPCARGKGDQKPGGSQTLNLRFSSDQKLNLDSPQSKFDCSSFRGSENIPVRNFSFWDGNRTMTSFPTLPDSTVLLAKYPAAFSNHSTSSNQPPPPPVHGAIRMNDHSLNKSVSVFPNGVTADYQQAFRNRELQPFALDMKQPQDVVFSEMQRRNGFDVMQQQQARGMVGINIVGRGGLLVGGQCSGVSDPVTAIKMHYAKAQNLSMQASNGVREDETWTSNGDVGR